MNIGLLVLRVIVGLGFAAHGSQKLFGAFGGGGINGTAGFFEQIGLKPGKAHAWFAGATELFGGLAIALGLLTPVAAAGLIGVMTAAVLTVHVKNGFFNTDQGYEYNLVLAAALFALSGIGAGQWSLDNALGLDVAGAGWAIAALAAGLLGGFGAVAGGRFLGRERGAHEHGHPTPA